MKGFLKELRESNAMGAFETVRTGEVALTPNKWHTMAVISGTGKLLQADLLGCIPYVSSAVNIGEGAWDMRILLDGEIFADVRMAVASTNYGMVGHLLATDFTYLLPLLEGRNTSNQKDLFGNLQPGGSYVNILAEKITEGKGLSSSAVGRTDGYMNVLPFIGYLPFQRSLEIQMAFLFANPSETLPEGRQCRGSVDIAYRLDEK
ncbi:MAG: hypothetical protein ACLVCB_01710 [Anaerotignum faecicola]